METIIEIFNANRSWLLPLVLFGISYVLLAQVRNMLHEIEQEEEADHFPGLDLALKTPVRQKPVRTLMRPTAPSPLRASGKAKNSFNAA